VIPPTPPIFIVSDDLYILPSVGLAESWLEPIDVEPGQRGYDAEGRLLHVVVRGGVRVEIVPAEESPGHAEELRAALSKWLAEVEAAPHHLTAPLSELVEAARKHAIGAQAQKSLGAKGRLLAVVLLGLLALWMWWLFQRPPPR
jgi:hypothetical protein